MNSVPSDRQSSTARRRPSPSLVLARREIAILFHSPATYVIGVIFLLLTGWLFASPLFQLNQSTLDAFVQPLPLIFTFVIPALTMRSFAEELREGTMEYLATLPIRDHEIVLAKYLGALTLVGALMLFTLAYPAALFLIGRPDPGQILGTYLAIAGLSSLFVSIGLWASSLTRNQVVAFIIGFFVCFGFFLLDRFAGFLPGAAATVVRSWGIDYHFDTLARGVLDTRDLIYWASTTLFFLAACLAVVHSRRWR